MTIVLAAIGATLLVGLAVVYNSLVRKRNLVADGWAGIDVQLARRAELVPNLVETVKGYRDFERSTLEAVAEARARVTSGGRPTEVGQADEVLAGSVKTLLAVSEDYPDLKSDANFLALQKELAVVEEDLAFARRYYNAWVRRFNEAQQRFPLLLVARPLGFRPAEYFQAEIDQRGAPDVAL